METLPQLLSNCCTIDSNENEDNDDDTAAGRQSAKRQFTAEIVAASENTLDIPFMIANFESGNEIMWLNALYTVRKALHAENNDLVEVIIESGMIPYLVEFLSPIYNKDLQYEAAWIFIQLCATTKENTLQIVSNDAVVPRLIDLVKGFDDVANHAIMVLSNISVDDPVSQSVILHHEIIEKIASFDPFVLNKTLMRNIAWLFSNLLCSTENLKRRQRVQLIVAFLEKALLLEDEDITRDVLWSCSYISDTDDFGSEFMIQILFDANLMPIVLESLKSSTISLIIPAILTVGNCLIGSAHQVNALINAGVIPVLAHLLTSPRWYLRKEASRSLGNIAVGTPAQIEYLLVPDVVNGIIAAMQSTCVKVQQEAAWFIKNIILHGTHEQIAAVIENFGTLKPFLELLDTNDIKLMMLVLECLLQIMDTVNKVGNIQQFCTILVEIGGLEKLKEAQYHVHAKVITLADKILATYFGGHV